jgi:hypothetical protein
MFGLSDNNRQDGTQQPAVDAADQTAPMKPTASSQAATIMPPNLSATPDLSTPDPSPSVMPSPLGSPSATSSDSDQHADADMSKVNLDNAYIPTSPSGEDEEAKPTAASLVQNTPQDDDLFKLKQQALDSLAPLVDQLDQSPEEKFKTTMMMIQASDNPQLVQEAYAAANKIEDEKTRAHALLDVVNEINYFTQHHQE